MTMLYIQVCVIRRCVIKELLCKLDALSPNQSHLKIFEEVNFTKLI